MSISGTRGLVRVSKNPECALQAAMALEGVKEPQFYEAVTGQRFAGEYGERVAARRRGAKFEANLHANGAALLRQAVAGLFGLDWETMYVRDFAQEVPGPPNTMRALRLVRTRRILEDLLAGREAPHLVIQPQFAVPSRGQRPDFYVSPDFMVLDPVARMYVPGEEKSFITRENVAEPADKDLTRRQAAAQVLGLRAVLEKIQVGTSAAVQNRAVFVFATPYGLRPAPPFIERIDAAVYELERAIGAMAQVQKMLKELRGRQPVDLAKLVDELPSHFQETCLGSCIMAGFCEKRLAGTARVLGDAASDLLGPMKLKRLAGLLTGKLRPNPHERELVAQLKQAAVALGMDDAELARRMTG